MDATGLTVGRYEGRWSAATYPERRHAYGWLKVHAALDADSKSVLAWSLTPPTVHDNSQLPRLLKRAGPGIREVYADAAYLSHASCWEVQAVGAVPYIRTKVTTKEAPPPNARGVHPNPFDAMVWRYQQDPEAWLAKYHVRSRIEGAFGSIKRRFGARLRSLGQHCIRIEACLRLVVWNLTRVKAGEF